MEGYIFTANHVEKMIVGLPILKDVSLKIRVGEVVAIKGHNGSGKSSLLKLIGGIYEPSNGKVVRNAKKIGYVPEHFPEKIRFKLQEYLLLIGEMNGRRKEELSNEVNQYVHQFKIQSFLHIPLKSCSKGTKQKVGIIQALLAKPDLLILDEPLTGLDEQSQHELFAQLSSVKGNCTIIFTTHEDLLITDLADRVIEVENGDIIENNKIASSKEIHKQITAIVPSIKSLEGIRDIAKVQYDQRDNAIILVESSKSDQILQELLINGCSIVELKEMR
jgi:ABC-type multidrug transport system ATPase subunit